MLIVIDWLVFNANFSNISAILSCYLCLINIGLHVYVYWSLVKNIADDEDDG